MVIAANREWLFAIPAKAGVARRRTGPPALGKPVRQARVVHRASTDRNGTCPKCPVLHIWDGYVQ